MRRWLSEGRARQGNLSAPERRDEKAVGVVAGREDGESAVAEQETKGVGKRLDLKRGVRGEKRGDDALVFLRTQGTGGVEEATTRTHVGREAG